MKIHNSSDPLEILKLRGFLQQHVLQLETSNLPYQGCLTRRRSTKWLQGKNQVRPAIISLKWEVNWENWVIYFDALVTSQTEVNLTLVILVDSFLCLYHSTPKVKFVFLQLNSNLFRYEEVQRVSGLLLITNIFELISSLFFTTGPSYARECCLWGFQSTNHFSTQNEWNIHYKATERGNKIKMEKKHLINSLPCVLVKQKELTSLKGTNTVANNCERINRIQTVNNLLKRCNTTKDETTKFALHNIILPGISL